MNAQEWLDQLNAMPEEDFERLLRGVEALTAIEDIAKKALRQMEADQ